MYDDSWFLSDLLNEYISSFCRRESGSLCGDILVVHFGVRLSRTTCCTTASIWYIWTILFGNHIPPRFSTLELKMSLEIQQKSDLMHSKTSRFPHTDATRIDPRWTCNLGDSETEAHFHNIVDNLGNDGRGRVLGEKKTQFFYDYSCFKKLFREVSVISNHALLQLQ